MVMIMIRSSPPHPSIASRTSERRKRRQVFRLGSDSSRAGSLDSPAARRHPPVAPSAGIDISTYLFNMDGRWSVAATRKRKKWQTNIYRLRSKHSAWIAIDYSFLGVRTTVAVSREGRQAAAVEQSSSGGSCHRRTAASGCHLESRPSESRSQRQGTRHGPGLGSVTGGVAGLASAMSYS